MIVFVPFCIIYLILGIYSVGECILSVSALEFWFYHRGAWFISLITPLYLISPLLFRFFQGKGKWLWATIIAVVLTLLCSISIDNQSNTSVWNNIQDAFGRAPSFIIGMAIAKECRDYLRISLLYPICLFVLYFPLHGLFPSAPLTWLFVPSILILLVWTLQLLVNIKWVERCLSFMGSISLESYLVNISFNALLNTVISYYCLSSSSLLYGKYLQYSIVIVVGTLLAFLVNKYSKKFLAKS